MTQFHTDYEKVCMMSYEIFVMLLNTTPIPDYDLDNTEPSSDGKGPITGSTSMLDYFKR